MNLVRNNTQYPAINIHNQGLGLRLFGKPISFSKWVKKGLKAAVGLITSAIEIAIPIIGKEITAEITAYTDDFIDGMDLSFLGSKMLVSGEITTSEELLLNNWLTKFNAYIEILISELGAASKLSPESQVTAINAVLNKINVIQDHYSVTPEKGLSENALNQRNYLIYESLKLVHETAQALIKNLQSKGYSTTVKSVSFPASAYNFNPLFSSTIVTSVTGDNHVMANTGAPSKNSVFVGDTVQYTGPLIGNTKPSQAGTVTTTKPEQNTTPVPVQTTSPVPTQNTTSPVAIPVKNTLPATPVPETKSNNTGLIIGGAVALGILYAATRKKKVSAKATGKKKKK